MSQTISNPVSHMRRPRSAFAAWFKDLRLWSPSSLNHVAWHWPQAYLCPLSAAVTRRIEEVDRARRAIADLQLITLHFDGTIEPRGVDIRQGFKGRLFVAHSGDVVYSKIDVRNGAIGIVPASLHQVAVSSEYPVYKVRSEVALPSYIKLLFRTSYFRHAINGMISGATGRKRVQPLQIEALEIALPPVSVQKAIVRRWREFENDRDAARNMLQRISDDLNSWLYEHVRDNVLTNSSVVVKWDDLQRWDLKTARAAAFRIQNPSFLPLARFAEEATDLVRPWEEPDKEWPIYGVNNKSGVFFSHHQKGSTFRTPYKRIRKDWFFHNPTRSSVGSLGIVPDVPEDALTSPEYQVWRIKSGLIPGYVAMLVNTPFFISLIQFHRVGAVKQRLYVDNLLEICVPVPSTDEQDRVAVKREAALKRIAEIAAQAISIEQELEEMILGTRPVLDI